MDFEIWVDSWTSTIVFLEYEDEFGDCKNDPYYDWDRLEAAKGYMGHEYRHRLIRAKEIPLIKGD